MKKQLVLLLVSFVAGNISTVSTSARMQQTMQSVQQKKQSIWQKINTTFGSATRTVRNYINSHGGCYFTGTCSPEVTARLKRYAIAAGVTVAALLTAAAAGGAYVYMQDKVQPSIPIGQYNFKPQISIEVIARKYGVTIPLDNSPVALIVRAALNGVSNMVESMKELVDKPILETAYEVADKQENMLEESKRGPYEKTKTILKNAILSFNPELFRRHILFINNAAKGLFAEVKAMVCSIKGISRNAINEAIEQLKRMEIPKFSGKEQVLNFLKNPECGK